MEDMQYAKYSNEIQDVLEIINANGTDGFENLVRNVVSYAISQNVNNTNWSAHELLSDVIEDKDIIEIFDDE